MQLADRLNLILAIAADRGELTSATLAGELAVTRAHANTLLRRLEQRGLLHAELIEGGRLRYLPVLERVAA